MKPSYFILLSGLLFFCFSLVSVISCGSRTNTGTTTPNGNNGSDHNYLMEKVRDTGVVRIYADEWNNLPVKQKILAYYLTRAAIAGDRITYDQKYRFNWEIKELIEQLYANKDRLNPDFQSKLEEYLKLFWINHGIHESWTSRKFLPTFTYEELAAATQSLLSQGINFGVANEQELIAKLERLRQPMFDQHFDEFCTNKSPEQGQDIITGSANTFYQGVTQADLQNFQERYSLNSRVVKREDGTIVEIPYRAGKQGVEPGLYAQELRAVIHYLREALPYAEEGQKRILEQLIGYFETGEQQDFRQYNILWVQNNDRIDAILGFIENYIDARGTKGAWEGIITYVNTRLTHLMQAVGQNAAYFESKTPWDPQYRRENFTPLLANAVDVIIGSGDGGPVSPVGINLPNAQDIREQYGSKNFFLTNLMDAANQVYGSVMAREFSLTPQDAEESNRCSEMAWNTLIMLHEVTGHGSGRVTVENDPHEYLREYYSTLEEARADLVALWHAYDPKLQEIGVMTDRSCADVMYRDYVTGLLTRLRRIPEGDTIEEDHIRAQSLIVKYAMERGAVIEVVRDGHYYLQVVDLNQLRQVWGELLTELMRIKATGDYNAIRDMVDRYGTHFNTAWRDDVIARVRNFGVTSYFAFVTPTLEPVTDAAGNITDVRLTPSNNLIDTILTWYRLQKQDIAQFGNASN